jgi:hypothetical protein
VTRRRQEQFHQRLQRLCRVVGIQNSTQLATAIARMKGDDRPVQQLSVAQPNQWWKGETNPSLDNFRDILAVTGGNGHWLATGAGEMFPPGAAARTPELGPMQERRNAGALVR